MQGVVDSLDDHENRVQAQLQGVFRATIRGVGHEVLQQELILGESLNRLEEVGGEGELVTQLDLSHKLLMFYQRKLSISRPDSLLKGFPAPPRDSPPPDGLCPCLRSNCNIINVTEKLNLGLT